MIFVGIAFKLENVVPICSSFNPRPSLASVQTDDRKQFHSLKIVFKNQSVAFCFGGRGGDSIDEKTRVTFLKKIANGVM